MQSSTSTPTPKTADEVFGSDISKVLIPLDLTEKVILYPVDMESEAVKARRGDESHRWNAEILL